jgi:integrase
VPRRGPVAQWSEQGTHNPSVGGSIPPGPTKKYWSERLLRERRASQAETALACGVGLEAEAYVLSDDAAGREPLHPNLLSDRFRRLVRVLKLRCRLHDLRHWHVTEALGAGFPVRDVAERVGHASARMTLDVYGHAIAESDRKAAEVVAGLLSPALGRPAERHR